MSYVHQRDRESLRTASREKAASAHDDEPTGWLDADFNISRSPYEFEDTEVRGGLKLAIVFALTLILPIMLLGWMVFRYFGEMG